MTIDNSTGKCASYMDKFGSIVDRMYMKLEASFLAICQSRSRSLDGFSV